jgi:hypothetical protein
VGCVCEESFVKKTNKRKMDFRESVIVGLYILSIVTVIVIGVLTHLANCHKQCDFGDKKCQEMCIKRYYCPAHGE